MEGTLGEGTIPGLLRDIYVGRKTGLLLFTRGSQSCAVRFAQGHIVHSQSSERSLRLGDVLVAHGLLRTADWQRADAVVVREGRRLGQVLKDLGLLAGDQLEEAIALQVRELLRHVFAWPDGRYRFQEQELAAFAAYDLTLKLSTGEMILEAVRRVEDAAAVRRALGDLNRVLVLSTDPLLRFQRVTLKPADGYLLSRVDGTLTASQILSIAPVPPEDAEKSLFGLLCVGLVDFLEGSGGGEESPETLRQDILDLSARGATLDHYQVLGVNPDATAEEVRTAFFRLARRFHPDVHHQAALADLRDKVETVFNRLTSAYRVLSDPRHRVDYDRALVSTRLAQASRAAPPSPALDEAEAGPPGLDGELESTLRRAEEGFAAGRYWEAIQQAQTLVEGASGRMRQRARLLLARCYLQNPHWSRQAEETLQAAVREDASNADAFFLLGTLYRDRGQARRSATMLARAAELKPRYAAVVAELHDSSAPSSRSWIKKLFG